MTNLKCLTMVMLRDNCAQMLDIPVYMGGSVYNYQNLIHDKKLLQTRDDTSLCRMLKVFLISSFSWKQVKDY